MTIYTVAVTDDYEQTPLRPVGPTSEQARMLLPTLRQAKETYAFACIVRWEDAYHYAPYLSMEA